jgi:hypothetical protein
MQKKFGFRPLGPANGPVKNRIFAANAAAIHPYSAAAVDSDELARMKEKARKEGGTVRP